MITEYQVIFRSLNSPDGEYVDYVRHAVKADSDANATAQIRTMIADLKRQHDIEFMARVEVLSQFDAVKFEVWPRGHKNATDAKDTAEQLEIMADEYLAETETAKTATANVSDMIRTKAAGIDADAEKVEAEAKELRATASDLRADAWKLEEAEADSLLAKAEADSLLVKAEAEAAMVKQARIDADADQVDKMEAEVNPFKVWGFADNRTKPEIDNGGMRIPQVSVYRSNPDNPSKPESLDLTPSQARQIAAAMVKAADAAERGTHKFEQEII